MSLTALTLLLKMINYDFDFLDLRNDKRPFLLNLIHLIESLLPSNSTDVAVISIDHPFVNSTMGINQTTNFTELVVTFTYVENLQVEERIPKKFWQIFSFDKYETVIYQNHKRGRVVLSYNDQCVSEKWKPSSKKLYV